MGVEIIRFSDREILKNIEGVYEMIQRVIEKRRGNPPHLNPLPHGDCVVIASKGEEAVRFQSFRMRVF